MSRCSRPIGLPVLAAIDPKESPGRSVAHFGPSGLGLGGGTFARSFSRCPGWIVEGSTRGLKVSSSSTVSPVYWAIRTYVSPRRTLQ